MEWRWTSKATGGKKRKLDFGDQSGTSSHQQGSEPSKLDDVSDLKPKRLDEVFDLEPIKLDATFGPKPKKFDKVFDQKPKGLDKGKGITSDFVPKKGFYQAITDESWESYQALLSIVEEQLEGFHRQEVLCGAADEVLSVLKSEVFEGSKMKKLEIEKLLGPITVFTFNQLLVICNLISDYNKHHYHYLKKEDYDVDDRYEDEFYQPRGEETWSAYHMLIDVIEHQVGVQSQVLLVVVADEVLSVLKNENIKNLEMKKESIEKNLGFISNDTFDLLVFIGKLIKDYPKPHMKNDVIKREGPILDIIKEEEKEEFIETTINDDDDDDDLVWLGLNPTARDGPADDQMNALSVCKIEVKAEIEKVEEDSDKERALSTSGEMGHEVHIEKVEEAKQYDQAPKNQEKSEDSVPNENQNKKMKIE